jgi:nicotinamidase-related amidase
MATLAFPKGKTAILIMDCQNDIVHENGKMAAMSNGAMAKLIRERSVLGTIARLAEAARKVAVPIIHCGTRIVPTISTRPRTRRFWPE